MPRRFGVIAASCVASLAFGCSGSSRAPAVASLDVAHAAPFETPRLHATRSRLRNGLDVVLSSDKTAGVVGVRVVVHSGSRDEAAGARAHTRLAAALLTEGTERLPRRALVDRLAESGLESTADVGADCTMWGERINPSALEFVLAMEADRLADGARSVTADAFEHAKTRVASTIERSTGDVPFGNVAAIVDAQLYGDRHPYGHTALESADDVRAATLPAIRALLASRFVASSTTLVVVGNFEPKQTLAWIEREFGALPTVPAPPSSKARASHDAFEPATIDIEAAVAAPRLQLTWATPALYAANDAQLDAIADLRGDLTDALLYKKLVSWVNVHNYSRELGGRLDVVLDVAPGHTIDEVIAAVHAQMATYAREREFATQLLLWERTRVRTRYQQLESVDSWSRQLAQGTLFADEPQQAVSELVELEHLSVDDIRRAFHDFLETRPPVVTRIEAVPSAPVGGRLVRIRPHVSWPELPTHAGDHA